MRPILSENLTHPRATRVESKQGGEERTKGAACSQKVNHLEYLAEFALSGGSAEAHRLVFPAEDDFFEVLDN